MLYVGDASEPSTEWGRYLRRMTDRPGWSVARLARESGIARQTLFDYIKLGAESVSIGTVRRIAEALEDDFVTTLLAAGNISIHATDDQLSRILTSDLEVDEQQDLIAYVQELRSAQRESLRAEVDIRLKRPRRGVA